jgi:hypothetical protein
MYKRTQLLCRELELEYLVEKAVVHRLGLELEKTWRWFVL